VLVRTFVTGFLADQNNPETLDAGGHCVLEMPSGTGKTVSLLSLIVAYQQASKEQRKLIYCSRTMSEIEKALYELKALMKYRAQELGYEEEFRGLGLTSRKNLCLHPSVKREKSGAVVDARCRSLTAGFVKEKKERGENVDVCVYHDVSLHSRLPEAFSVADLTAEP
jgi:DNA excision repair protein ERCC-2